jgi:hypothetical protein
MEGIFMLLALALGIVAAVVTLVVARRSRRNPGGVQPPGSGSSASPHRRT